MGADLTGSADRGRAWLVDALGRLPDPDASAAAAVRRRADDILRPAGALARLDDAAVFLAGWQRSSRPRVTHPAGLIFAADHGVAAAGVSNYPTEVTAAMLAAYRANRSTVTTFAAVVGATVTAVDVGVGRPTADLRVEAALTPDRVDEAIDAGRDAVEALPAATDLLVLGEMGIGNTTAAAAVCAALAGDVDERSAVWVGRGTGVDDDGLARKRAAVGQAVARLGRLGRDDPLAVLGEVGGAELVAMAAALVAARLASIPVVLDGFVVGAAAWAVGRARPGALAHCLAGHRSAEPGHRRLLEALALQPLLDLDLRLGEGSGAMAAIPLLRLACAGVTDVPTFAEWFGPGAPGS